MIARLSNYVMHHPDLAVFVSSALFRFYKTSFGLLAKRSELTYAFELAVERIGGAPLNGGFETWQMRRGTNFESRYASRNGENGRRRVWRQRRQFHRRRWRIRVQVLSLSRKAARLPHRQRCERCHRPSAGMHVDHRPQVVAHRDVLPSSEIRWPPALAAEFKRVDHYIEQLEADLWQFKLLVDGYLRHTARIPLARKTHRTG